MTVKNWTTFLGGIDHADKFQIQNCDKLTGTVTEVSIDYKKRSKKQDGWQIGLKEYEFKVRIVGEYFNTLDH